MNGHTGFDAGEGPAPTELIGRYRLVGLTRTARHGAVFQAHDTVRDEEIAVKAVRRDLTGDAGTRAQLVRDLKRARRLHHPNVVRTRELVLVPTDVGADVFVTTEYVPGLSLARRIREQGPLSIHEVLRIGRIVADALVAAHAEGVLHGDLDPEHVLLADDGRVLLTDFGMGPALGRPPTASLDERTDVYGLGVVLYASLVGRTDGIPVDPRLHRVPLVLAEIVLGCLVVDPRERWGSIERVRAALRAIRVPFDDRSVVARPRVLGGARVAVFPITAEPALRHLADAVSEEITQTLAMTHGLRVRSLHGQAGSGAAPLATFDVAVRGELAADGPDVVLTLRLLSASNAWKLWVGRFEAGWTGVLPSAHRAAQRMVAALGSAPVPTRHPGPTDPEALDLLLRGQLEARRSSYVRFDRAAALLELARARAPTDPRVLAAVATARLRRASGGAPTDLLASAERFARDAIQRAPGLVEAHLALAEILRYVGDTVGAAHATRRALALSPGSAAARAAAGRLWREAGDLDASVAHLEQAAVLDPQDPSIRVDLARGWALLGRPEAMDEACGAVERCRFALWFPDRPLGILPVEPRSERLDLLVAVRGNREVAASAWAALETLDADDHQLRAVSAQLAIEARLFSGHAEEAFEGLERAVHDGLVDLVWFDRCPLLHALRDDARFVALRPIVARRARAIRRALDC